MIPPRDTAKADRVAAELDETHPIWTVGYGSRLVRAGLGKIRASIEPAIRPDTTPPFVVDTPKGGVE